MLERQEVRRQLVDLSKGGRTEGRSHTGAQNHQQEEKRRRRRHHDGGGEVKAGLLLAQAAVVVAHADKFVCRRKVEVKQDQNSL